MSAEQHRLLASLVGVVHPEGVPHIPRRVALGDVQHLEVVVVPLNLGAFHHAEAHADEGGADFADDLGGGMEPPLCRGPSGQGDVEAVFVGGPQQGGLVYLPRPRFQPAFQRFLGLVGQGADASAFLNIQSGQPPEEGCEAAATPQIADAPLFQGFRAFQRGKLGEGRACKVFDILLCRLNQRKPLSC